MPVGITAKDIQECKQQIKELSNAIDVEIYHDKDNIVHIDAYTEDDVKAIEGSIPTKKWNEFWKTTEVYTGNVNDGYKYPTLIEENKIPGGKSYVFKMPIGKSTFHITKQDITVKEFLKARLIEVEVRADGNVEIKAIYDELPKEVPYELIERENNGFTIPIGKSIDGVPTIDFSQRANLIVAGDIGSGKSTVTKWIITYLGCMFGVDELDIYLADLKVLELCKFRKLKHVQRFVDNVDDLITMIHELKDEMDRRYKIFAEVGVKDIYKYNEKYPNDKMKYIVLVIEEFAEYTSELNSRCGRNEKHHKEIVTLKRFLSKARASGIMTIPTIQRPTAENMHPDIKSYLGNKIGLLATNKLSSAVICDDEELLLNLRGQGHGYFISQTNPKKPREEFQAFYIDDDEIEELLKEKDLLRDSDAPYGYAKDKKENKITNYNETNDEEVAIYSDENDYNDDI